jgi:hypothetical protein
VNKSLADFVFNHDEEGALLIVYYAGHGRPEKSERPEKKEFHLAG